MIQRKYKKEDSFTVERGFISKHGFEPRTIDIIKSSEQAAVKVRIKLLCRTTERVRITGLWASTECPNQALNWELQKNCSMSLVSLPFQLAASVYDVCIQSFE
jgi:hypothetical protein